jgi:inner membrane protein
MPSPIGHVLAGAAIAIVADQLGRGPTRSHVADRFSPAHVDAASGVGFVSSLAACMLFAALPDADLLYQPIHRAFTHSVGSTILVTIIATVVTGWVTGRRSIAFGVLCGLAWGSHSLLDWLGADPNPPRGIKALWPFSDQWFISGWDIFRGTERRRILTLQSMIYNARTVAQEIAMLAPITAALFWWRARRLRRGRPESPHP